MTLTAPHGKDVQSGFADCVVAGGNRPALITADATLTYAELDERVAEVGRALGDVRRLVLLEADNSIDVVVAYLAALRGHHPVLVAPARDEGAFAALVETYNPDVTATANGDLIEHHRFPAHVLHPDLALLLSTSGSTGAPKLVRLSRRNLESNAAAIAEYLDLGGDDRTVTTLPMHYCYGLSVLNSHLHAGAAIALSNLSVVDQCFWDLARATGVTGLAGVPHTFDLLDRIGFEAIDLPELRYLTQAGGRMAPETVARYARLGRRRGWELYVMYGQTEATARMAYLPPALAATHPAAIGIPIPGGSLAIDDADDADVGELVYRGPNVMLGYAHSPADLGSGATVAELRTGDLARRNAHGLYEIVGRRSRLIKPFGVRVDLDDLERVLADHGITALCTGDDGQLEIAVFAAVDVPVVTDLVEARLRLPSSRVHVVALDEPPRLANGKPDYAAVRAAVRRDDGPVRMAPTPGDHAAVRTAFTDVLGVDAGEDDSFVTLGGDSLSYVEMSVRLEEIIGALPRQWHVSPIRDLTAASASGSRWWAPTDTSLALRALAIVLIVGTHANLWHHPGGAHALLAVAGYNFARFQLGASTMFRSIARVAVPSMAWIGIVAATSDDFGWPHALLVNGQRGGADSRWAYWFIEALVQILLTLAVVFAVPAVARIERRRPFLIAGAAVTLGLVVRFDLVELASTHRISRPSEVFWLFALGWLAARATGWPQRVLVSAVAAATVFDFFGDSHRELIVITALVLVVWLPTIPLPRRAVAAVASVAGGSLYIYLTHFQVYPIVNRLSGPALAVAASLAVGVVASVVGGRLMASGERLLDRRRVPSGGRATLRGRGKDAARVPSASIGSPEDLLGVFARRLAHRHPDPCPQRDPSTVGGESSQPLADTFGHSHRRAHIGGSQENGEFVAGETGDDVAAQCRLLDLRGGRLQDTVARGVSEVVVHRGEVGQRDDYDRNRRSVGQRRRQRAVETVDEQRAVGESR